MRYLGFKNNNETGETNSEELAELKTTVNQIKNKTDNLGTASTRNVGVNNGNLVEMTDYGVAGTGIGGVAEQIGVTDLNLLTKTGFYSISTASVTIDNIPVSSGVSGVMLVIARKWTGGASVVQILSIRSSGDTYWRTGNGGELGIPKNWTKWGRLIIDGNNDIYNTTTASSPNVVVTASGELQRSTSSERYKKIIKNLELDDEAYNNAMQLRPIVYRSTAESDNPNWHYYSFSAETLGRYDRAFTLWRNTETVTDDEGNTETVELDEPIAEGINLNAIVAFLHATNIKQGQLIADLQKRIEQLEGS